MPCRWRRGMRISQCWRKPAGIGTPQPLLLSWCAVLCCVQAKPHDLCGMYQSLTHKCMSGCHTWPLCLCKCVCFDTGQLGSIAAAASCTEASRCYGRLYQMCHHPPVFTVCLQVRNASLGLLNEAFLSYISHLCAESCVLEQVVIAIGCRRTSQPYYVCQ